MIVGSDINIARYQFVSIQFQFLISNCDDLDKQQRLHTENSGSQHVSVTSESAHP